MPSALRKSEVRPTGRSAGGKTRSYTCFQRPGAIRSKMANIVTPDVNRDSALGAAAALIWSNLIRVVADREAPARLVSQAMKPVYGIAWNRAVIKLVKGEVANDTLCKLRGSLLPRREYGRLAIFLKGDFSAASELPPELLKGGPFQSGIALNRLLDGAPF